MEKLVHKYLMLIEHRASHHRNRKNMQHRAQRTHGNQLPWLQSLPGMLQSLIRLFLGLLLETNRNTDCVPPAAARSSNGRGVASSGG